MSDGFHPVLRDIRLEPGHGYDTVVNGMLGVQTSKVINDESVEDEDTIYYKSAYGDINAKTLKVLKEDTYTEAVQEQEEGTVLLYNKDNALPLSKDEQISLFGHAVVQPLYRNQSAGSRAYSTKTGVDLYKALGTLKFKVNPKLYNAYRQSKTERKTAQARSLRKTPIRPLYGRWVRNPSVSTLTM